MAKTLFGRRDVLRMGAGAGLAAALLPACASDNVDAPAIVIGSGFGGAIASLRLTQKGINTILIERGKRWSIDNPAQSYDPFCTNLDPDGRAAWLQELTVTPKLFPQLPINKYIGMLDLIQGNGMDVYAGAGYGGGSLVYGGITLQPSQQRFERNFPSEITYAEMTAKWFPLVAGMLGASSTPTDVAASDVYDYVRTFQPIAESAGLNVVPLPTVTNWDIIRKELNNGYTANGVPWYSATHGELIYGNNTGSKLSLDQTYLKQAEATGKLDVRLQTLVTNFSVDGNRYVVEISEINELGETVSSSRLTCNYLFLACGSVYTTGLLYKARATRSLSKVNEQLGQGWGSNGDCMFMLQNYTQPTGVWQGGPPSIGIDDADNPIAPGYIELAQYPTGFEEHTTVHLGVAMTQTLGQLVYDAETETCAASMPQSGLDEIQSAVASTVSKITAVDSALTTDFLGGFTYHPIGGASMNAVCDTYGRVDGYKNLYVMDSALIPGPSVGINPSFTIAAIVERAMAEIISTDLK